MIKEIISTIVGFCAISLSVIIIYWIGKLGMEILPNGDTTSSKPEVFGLGLVFIVFILIIIAFSFLMGDWLVGGIL